jgi:hypothetical protein
VNNYRYLLVLNEKIFSDLMADHFSVLNTVRKAAQKQDVSITLSMAFARGTDSYEELDEMVARLLDLAQSRGGDQVAVQNAGEDVKYFGGSSEATEKRSRVRVRVMAHTLREMILRSSNVIICGHRNADFDCIGSAIGGYIILLAMALAGLKSVFPFFVPGFFIMAAVGILNVVVTIFLANTVDYGHLKNNRRDESVIFSMQTFVVKLASGIAALIASISLSVNNLKADAGNEAEQLYDFSKDVAAASKLGLRMTMTIIPIIGLIVAIAIFYKKFILTEEKMASITDELSKRNNS